MKTISNWQDLEAYGIDALTGESCGLGYRLLCDVTAKGKAIIEKLLGCRLSLAENWNSGRKDDPHIGSIMLPLEMLGPIGVFSLLESGCTEVWLYKNGATIGIEPTDDEKQIRIDYQFCTKAERILRYRGTAGDRNVHMMSGRIQ